jgi:hypothetical protein
MFILGYKPMLLIIDKIFIEKFRSKTKINIKLHKIVNIENLLEKKLIISFKTSIIYSN